MKDRILGGGNGVFIGFTNKCIMKNSGLERLKQSGKNTSYFKQQQLCICVLFIAHPAMTHTPLLSSVSLYQSEPNF